MTQYHRLHTYWTIAWAISFVAAFACIRWLVPSGSLYAWLVAIWPALVSIGTLRSYLQLVAALDELLKKIELESLAVGFGAGLVFNYGYFALEYAGAPSLWFGTTGLVMILFKTVFQI